MSAVIQRASIQTTLKQLKVQSMFGFQLGLTDGARRIASEDMNTRQKTQDSTNAQVVEWIVTA